MQVKVEFYSWRKLRPIWVKSHARFHGLWLGIDLVLDWNK